VFITSKEVPPKPDRVSKRFAVFVEKAKLPDRDRISFHNLRHSTASWLVASGVPMRVVQEVLGHSTIQVTQRYSHVSPDMLGKAMDAAFGG
jgi:site-specific recombinase XerD